MVFRCGKPAKGFSADERIGLELATIDQRRRDDSGDRTGAIGRNILLLYPICRETDRQRAPGGRLFSTGQPARGEARMNTVRGSANSELYEVLLPFEPSDEPPPGRPTIILENDRQPSLRKRASRALFRFPIVFCI